MRYKGPRNKLARREGMDLGLKTPGSKSQARLLKKLNVRPGQHGTRSRRKITEHAFQLREKQKLRYIFGLSEKQMKKYFQMASKKRGNTAQYLAQFLEKRLDNVVYRLGFSPTRNSARQIISHGHIKVGDRVVTVPSYQVKPSEIIAFSKEKSTKIPYIEKSLNEKEIIIPEWLERKAAIGKMMQEPTQADIDKQINLRLVIEFYSR